MFSRSVPIATFLLLATLAGGCSGGPVFLAQPSSANPFLGVWVNEDPATRNNTRIQIVREHGNLAIRMWGACVPIDCDWGTQTVAAWRAMDGVLELTWDRDFVVRTQKLTISSERRLRLDTHNVYQDGRPDQIHVDFFFR